VFYGVAQAVEGFAECEVGYYVKGCKVCWRYNQSGVWEWRLLRGALLTVPCPEINFFIFSSVFAQTLDEKIDIGLDETFLCSQSLFAESVGEATSHSRMTFFVRHEKRTGTVYGWRAIFLVSSLLPTCSDGSSLQPLHVLGIDLSLVLSGFEAVDILPRSLSGDEADFIWF
jgi:hypothetical protein